MPRAVYDPEYLEENYRKRQEEESKNRAAEELRLAKEAGEVAESATEMPEEGEDATTTVNPLDNLSGPAEGLSSFLENAAVGIRDFVDDTFQGDQLTREQIVENREALREEGREQAEQFEEQLYQDPASTVAAEAVRVGTGAVVGTVEDTLNTADLLGDVIKKGLTSVRGLETKPTEDPFSDRYVAAAYSFGTKKPKTEVGKMAAKLAEIIVITRQLMVRGPGFLRLGVKGGPKNIKQALREGVIPGAIADFITTTPEDGNFSAMVNSFIPEDHPLHDSFLTALRSEEDDDPFTAKVKGSLEGGVIGSIADGFLWLSFGRKAAQRAIRNGATKEQALETGLKESQKKMKEVDAQHTKAVAEEADRFDDIYQEQFDDLTRAENDVVVKMANLQRAGVKPEDPRYKAVMSTLEDIRLHKAEIDENLSRGYNPDDLKGADQQDVAAINTPAKPQTAVEQQLKAENPDPGAPFPKEYTPLESGGAHMMTDAQYKIMAYRPEAEQLIRQYSKDMDLQAMAAKLKVPVADILRHAADKLEDFRSALKPEAPADELKQMMKDNGLLDPDSKSDKLLSKSGILVTKALIGDTAEQIHQLAKEATELRQAGAPPGNLLDRSIDRLVSLLEFHKFTAYKTGSTLEIFKRRIGMPIDEAANRDNFELSIKEVREWSVSLKNKLRSGDPAAQAEADRLINMMVLAGGDPTNQVKFVTAAIVQGAKQATTAMYQSILSGPITHFRNAVGNSYSLVERPLSAYLRGVVTNDKSVRASALAGANSLFSGLGDAWKIAKQTYKTGTSVNFNAKFAVQDFETQAMLRQMELAATTPSEKMAVGFLRNSYRFQNNPWVSWPSRALMASDDFFKSLAARYRLYSKAKYEAIMHAVDDESVDALMDSYVKKFSQGIDPGTGRILDKDLLNYAERATFQQDPGAIVNALANFVDQLPLGSGRLFLPFIRTPGNLLGYGLEHLPGANKIIRQMDKTYIAAKKNGDRMLMAELEGRYATGLMTMGLLTTVAMFTDVTGNYPPNEDERKAWQAEGRPPMSIKIGGVWVSYASFEPINSFLSVTADIVRLTKMGGAEGASRAMQQLVYSITAGYTDKSFLAGLSDLGEIFSPKNMNDPSGFRMALNMANNYVPASGLRRAFANSVDPYMKELRGELDRMLIAAAPGYGNDLPSVTSWISGDKLHSSGGGLFNAVSPIRIQNVNDNFVAQKLSQIGYPSNELLKTGNFGVKLEPRHREQLAKILAKSGLTKRLEKIMRDPEWKKMEEAYRGRPVDVETFFNDDESNPPHIRMITREISKYRRTALNKLMQQDPSYKELVAAEKYKRQRQLRGDFSQAEIDVIKKYAGIE